jgi:hypothetical protein
MSISALVILKGSINRAFPCICVKAAAAQGNVFVEVVLPKGGHGLQLPCSVGRRSWGSTPRAARQTSI